jgi:hypothetical protein
MARSQPLHAMKHGPQGVATKRNRQHCSRLAPSRRFPGHDDRAPWLQLNYLRGANVLASANFVEQLFAWSSVEI